MSTEDETQLTDTNSEQQKLSFWQFFGLTAPGVAGFISFLVDGPRWLTYTGLGFEIVALLWWIYKNQKK